MGSETHRLVSLQTVGIDITHSKKKYDKCGISSPKGIVRFRSRWKAPPYGEIRHRLVARPGLDNTFWTDSAFKQLLFMLCAWFFQTFRFYKPKTKMKKSSIR